MFLITDTELVVVSWCRGGTFVVVKIGDWWEVGFLLTLMLLRFTVFTHTPDLAAYTFTYTPDLAAFGMEVLLLETV